ncbi:MAG: hypothetical protein ABI954_05140 [Pyrinomonadaceae bacterium]
MLVTESGGRRNIAVRPKLLCVKICRCRNIADSSKLDAGERAV